MPGNASPQAADLASSRLRKRRDAASTLATAPVFLIHFDGMAPGALTIGWSAW